MVYAEPQSLILLIILPLLILFYFIVGKMKKRALSVFGSLELLQKLMKSVSKRKSLLKKMLIFTVFLLMILAAARPQFGTRIREVHRRGVDIFIVLDTSLSMQAEDVKPSRLIQAKREIDSFFPLLKGDRIGLVCFAGVPFIQCPLTLDYGAAKVFLDIVDTNLIPVKGTAIGSAIKTAVDAFKNKEMKYKVIILITDGEDHNTKPIEAAKYAKKNGVVIYTIGIGTRGGNPIPIKNKSGTTISRKKGKDGAVVISKLGETTLLKIANITGGKYHRATAGELELEKIYSQISKMNKKDLKTKIKTYQEDRFQYFLFFALLFLAIETVISERRKIKHEWSGRFK